MKKTMIMLAALLLTLVCAAGQAQDYYTLPEVREQAAQGWHETYTDKYGREIAVDIDIDVFGGDKAPVIRTDVPEFVEYRYYAGYPYGSVTDVARKGGKRTHPYWTRGEEVDLDTAYGAAYGNDLTVREAYDFLARHLEEHGQGYTVDDFILNPPEEFEVVYSRLVATGGVHVPALYNIQFWQQMHGLPILAGAEEGYKEPGSRSYYPHLSFQMRNGDEKEQSIVLVPLREVETLAEDVPLCGVDAVIDSIEGWIEDGYVQHVTALRFGYAVYSDPSIVDFRKSNPEDEWYVLKPTWVMECVFSSDPKAYKADEIDTLREGNEQFGEYQPLSKRIIDAQTGEMFDYFDRSRNDGGDGTYRGFIAWEDVR